MLDLVSNLISSRSLSDLPPTAAETTVAPWITEYVTGAAKEIYSCLLHPRYHNLTFLIAAEKINRETEGGVLLVAVENDKSNGLEFNPAHRLTITPHTMVSL